MQAYDSDDEEMDYVADDTLRSFVDDDTSLVKVKPGETLYQSQGMVEQIKTLIETGKSQLIAPGLQNCLLGAGIVLVLASAYKTAFPAPTVVQGWVRPPVVYGLVHIAKTAGTEINGMLAAKYERVCGNKGYSYDSYQHNKRAEKQLGDLENNAKVNVKDSYSHFGKDKNRGLIPLEVMDEIGYEDCDYIAFETNRNKFADFSHRWPMELHVPCREPLNHIMSQCNHNGLTFNCDAEDLLEEIRKCSIGVEGRVKSFFETDFVTKCFDSFPPARYVEYMGNILQHKRMPVEYFHMDSNTSRNKDKECIWSKPQEFQDKVRQMIIDEYVYYQFCERCIGSDMELPLKDVPGF